MGTCLEYEEQRTESCAQYADQGDNACSEWRDQGHNACAGWDSRCCDWWPCSWACKLVTWVCVGWYWVSSWVCVAWVWVANVVCVLWTVATTLVCVVWDAVTTVVAAVVEVVDAVVGSALNLVAGILEAVFAIPFVGRVLQWAWNVFVTAVWIVPTVVDGALYLVGIRPQKKLRVCTIVLRDEDGNPVAPVEHVVNALNDAIDVFLRECNVQLVNSAPLQFATGLALEPNRADDSWVQVEGTSSPGDLLDGRCDAGGFADDVGTVGSRYQLTCVTSCFWGNWRRVTGLGAPVVVLVVRSINFGRPDVKAGCALWVPDYLTLAVTGPNREGDALRPGDPYLDGSRGRPMRTLAHELGHMCNLWHTDEDPPNLMCTGEKSLRGTLLRAWQEALVRASRHVSYV